jgi:hypothetical protein
MKRKLLLATAVFLVCLAFFSSPSTVTADRDGDFCEPYFGCRLVNQGGMYQCVCDSLEGICTICCVQGAGCCWDSEHCVE